MKILDAEFAKRDLVDWRAILDGVGVTFGIVGTVDEVLDDRQMRDSGALVPFEDGDHFTISSPFHIEGVDKVPARRAPALGQHSEVVLREAGYTADDIARLLALGVLA